MLLNVNLKKPEMHGCIISIVATDVLVLKHKAFTLHGADQVFVVLDQLHTNILYLYLTMFYII